MRAELKAFPAVSRSSSKRLVLRMSSWAALLWVTCRLDQGQQCRMAVRQELRKAELTDCRP